MARVPYLDKADLAPDDRELLDNDINLRRALVNSPKAARASSHLMRFMRSESRLDPRLREMAILQVAYLARAPYEYVHHIELAHKAGISDAEIRAIANDTIGRETMLDPLTRAVLRAAREMTRKAALSDETFAPLKKELDPERLVDLFYIVSHYIGVVRLLAALQIEVEEKYRHYLEEFPLPAG